MNTNTLITIVTATYNLIEAGRKDTFIQMCESVKNQDYPYIQHLIIDGDSKDGTIELIESLGLEYVSEPDDGIYDAMNKGARLAKGKYIAFLNSDDFYHDMRAVSECVNALEGRGIDFVCANTLCFFGENPAKNFISYVDFKSIYKKIPFGHQALFCKAEILRKNPFDLQYKIASDYDFVFRLFLNKYKGIVLPFTFVTFRMGGACFHADVDSENIDIQKKYLPFKKEIFSQMSNKESVTIPKVSIVTLIPQNLTSSEKEKISRCKQSVKEQTYNSVEHIFYERKSDYYSHDLGSAIREAYGDYLIFISANSVLKSSTAIEEIMKKFEEEKVQAIYFNLETENDKVAYVQKQKLLKRKDFFDISLPYQAVVYKRSLFDYADFQKEADFNDFSFHLKLFVEKGFAYASLMKEFVSLPYEEISSYTDEEKAEKSKNYKKFLNKKSPYEQAIWKKRIKIFNKITLMRIIENMWERKYYLMGILLVKTEKK